LAWLYEAPRWSLNQISMRLNMAKIGFKKLSAKIAKEPGYTKSQANAAAAAIGRAKYGNKGMAKKAAAGRKRAAKKGS
jgi:hypothetical protein